RSCRRLSGAGLREVLGPAQGLLFDCDGVLWAGERAVPGAPELLERLRRSGKAALFVSNNSRRSVAELERRFSRLGFRGVRAEHVFSSALCSALFPQRPPRRRRTGAGPAASSCWAARGCAARCATPGCAWRERVSRHPASRCAPSWWATTTSSPSPSWRRPVATCATRSACWWPPTPTPGTRSATASALLGLAASQPQWKLLRAARRWWWGNPTRTCLIASWSVSVSTRPAPSWWETVWRQISSSARTVALPPFSP
uniref:Uncharacterized protein n=1 Tax=Malurus cyaneus samueli TaxID=2593467 RepID=A0A8C5U799_9PASS